MCNAHLGEVRNNLSEDKAYNKFTLAIFDAYVQDIAENEIQLELTLSPSSFKVFERVIERCIFSFYGIEDSSIRDMIFSSIFYAVYGSNEKSKADKTVELEELFHSLKQFDLEQESSLISSKLYELNISTQLEPVYQHLSVKYTSIAYKNQICFSYLNEFNSTLTEVLADLNDKKAIKQLIFVHKKIRSLYNNNINNTSKAIYNLTKFILVALVGQNQILNESTQSVEELLAELSKDMKLLPFGMERFYLNNIYTHAYSNYLANTGSLKLASHVLNKKNEIQLFESFNFNFPNHISRNILNQTKMKLIKTEKEISNTSSVENLVMVSTTKPFLSRDYFPNTILN